MTEYFKRKSKLLSLVLRHSPAKIGIELDGNGWADVSKLLIACSNSGYRISLAQLKEIVANNDKMRFSFNEDGSKIRANQGHSIKNIDLEFKEIEPPVVLYHGTVAKFMGAIRETGLQKMNRQHVHLSETKNTAIKVGSRRGKPNILVVKSGLMFKDGYKFYRSENGVWLTGTVPWKYIEDKNV